jgi:predicted porin
MLRFNELDIKPSLIYQLIIEYYYFNKNWQSYVLKNIQSLKNINENS